MITDELILKNSATTVYVNAGSAMGIVKGQLFDVIQIKDVAGNVSRVPVGKLAVTEIHGDNLALCKVVKGGDVVKASFDNPEQVVLVVQSAGTRTFSF